MNAKSTLTTQRPGAAVRPTRHRFVTLGLSFVLTSVPTLLLAETVVTDSQLRIARVGQNCAECFELPPCAVPTPYEGPTPCEVPTPCEEPSPREIPAMPPTPPQYGMGEESDEPADQLPTERTPTGPDAEPDDIFDGQGPGAASSLSGMGAVAASESSDVNMIGDFFSSAYYLGDGAGNFVNVPSAGGDRRFKATDNLSPLPQDRVFFNYHHFHNAVLDINDDIRNLDRYTIGLERTCLDDTISLEVRVPMATGLTSTQTDFETDTLTSEFGNVALTVKAFLWQWRSVKFASGMAITLPTADDGEIQTDSGTTQFRNNAVHLQPYFGMTCARPGSRWFSTSYIGVDVDVSGNEIYSNAFSSGEPVFVGEVQDQSLLYCDCQVGYWWYQDYGHVGYLNGIAPVVELHYSQLLDDPDNLGQLYTNPYGQNSLLNMTMGLVFDFRRKQQINVYAAAPLKRDEANLNGVIVSPVFTAEVGAQWVCRY
jgi:hypothetical protein